MKNSMELAKEFEDVDPDINEDMEETGKAINELDKDIDKFVSDIKAGDFVSKKNEKYESETKAEMKIPKLHMLTLDQLLNLSEEELMFEYLKFQIWNASSKKIGIVYGDNVDIEKIENVVRKIQEAKYSPVKAVKYKSRKLVIEFTKDWIEEQSSELLFINDFIGEIYLNRIFFIRKSSEFQKKLVADLLRDEMSIMFSYMRERGYDPQVEKYKLILNCNWVV